MRIAVLSDTHSPRFWKRCPPAVAAALEGVDLILHAGDVCLRETLEELEQLAPVRAVRGNNDGPDIAAWGAPETLSLELGGVQVAMVHDSGPKMGRGPRLRRLFPEAELVVFGHSHIPWDETYDAQRAFNPGSPTDKRRQPHGTMGELVIEDGVLLSARIFAVT
jgi:putative phosphoesterase